MGGFARISDDQDILPSVIIEVVDEGSKVVQIAVRVKFCCGINLMFGDEVMPGIPIGSTDQIHFSIIIQITESRALRIKLIRKVDFFTVGR